MNVLSLVTLIVAVGADGGADAPRKGAAATPRLSPQPHQPQHASNTSCAACHSTANWSAVRFNHERTGYPLTGQHAGASCKSCHVSDFTTPPPRLCQGCHRDVHAGELGARCDGCHETQSWASRFDADAHRRSNFPLIGSHAALPCVECHVEARERRWSRTTVDCSSCHQAALIRTSGSAVDHSSPSLQFVGQPCQQCHMATRWSPARFPAHDHCFPLTGSPHAAVPCLQCHRSLSTSQGSCRTQTASLCVDCHTNTGGAGNTSHTDEQHRDVPGYVFVGTRCAQCHASPGGAP